jgi:hypothetical protein
MGKASVAVRNAAVAIAAELGVKPSRTIRQVRALASAIHDVAPRKGSEGRRPVTGTEDWVTPVAEVASSWGYVVQGAPKRVVSLPDSNPEYWSLLQGEILLGHVRNSFAKPVGEQFDYIRGRVSRVNSAQVAVRYLQRYQIRPEVEVTVVSSDTIEVAYLDWDQCAEDVDPVRYTLSGSARRMIEHVRTIDILPQGERDY